MTVVAAAPSSPVAAFVRSALRRPDACAISAGGENISYSALLGRSRAVAAYLQCNGLQPGERVALFMANSIDFVAICYGALLAGAVVVLLNAAGKANDLATWLAHSGSTWLFADTTAEAVVAARAQMSTALRVVMIGPVTGVVSRDTPIGEIFDQRQEPREFDHDAGTPACILYTSGTTDRPKAVTLSHGNLAANSGSIVEYLELTERDSIVQVLPFYYAYGSSILHTHLQVGGRIVLEPNLVYPHRAVETLARERASGFAGVPSTFALLLSRVELRDYDLSNLRYVTQAGGPMAVALANRLRAALPHTRIFVMYGQTEATARLTYVPPQRLAEKPGSVGIPIPGVEVEVRGEGGRLAVNETGEIHVRGANVMLGYWRDAAATAEVLRDGWLRTGDMGYFDADGYLFIAGRRSDMIKTGAHRVHPQEIEAVIQSLDAVEECAVVGVADEMLGEVIKAFVVVRAGAMLDDQRVKARCREHLASYKIPKWVEIVTSLPKTASGKVERRNLKEKVS